MYEQIDDHSSPKSNKIIIIILICLCVCFASAFGVFLYFFLKSRHTKITVIGLAGQKNFDIDLAKYNFTIDQSQSAFIHALNRFDVTTITLPVMDSEWNEAHISNYIDLIDGLILQGGIDIDPSLYNEDPKPGIGNYSLNMDKFHISLYKEAKKRKIPILGICRGFQLLNVAEGGSMYQDYQYFPYQGQSINHRHTSNYTELFHKVQINKSSKVYKWFDQELIDVNSLHHQIVHKPGEIFNVVGYAPDGAPEIIEPKDENEGFIYGVQFHPEYTDLVTDKLRPVFVNFIEAVKNNK